MERAPLSQANRSTHALAPNLRSAAQRHAFNARGLRSRRGLAGADCLGEDGDPSRGGGGARAGSGGGVRGLRNAFGNSGSGGGEWRGIWAASDRMDDHQHSFPASTHGGKRLVRCAQGPARHARARPACAGDSDRVLLRCVLRGHGGVWRTCGGDGRDADAARILATEGVWCVADREHGTRRVWLARHATDRAQWGHRHRLASAVSDGRPTTAGVFAHHSVLGGRGLQRLAWNARRVASGVDGGTRLRGAAVRRVELPRPLAGGHHRVAVLDGCTGGSAARVAARRHRGREGRAPSRWREVLAPVAAAVRGGFHLGSTGCEGCTGQGLIA